MVKNMHNIKSLRLAIREAMGYAVEDGDLEVAADLLVQYRQDRIALDLLMEFYSFLPEAQMDYVQEILLVARSRGVFLLAAKTVRSVYLYLISSEGVEFHGTLDQGYLAPDLLDFFDFPSHEDFQRHCAVVTDLPRYEPLQIDADICPACHVVTGELHELGCPVEVCPWCGGQLIGCSCRFDRLGVDILTAEEELLRFEALLEEQGRVAYAPDQRPGYLDEGPGIHVE